MKARDIMATDIATVAGTASLADAARTMWDHDCGIVPVVSPSDGGLIGVITDRDVCMGALNQGKPLSHLRVVDSMTTDPHTCDPDTDLRTIEKTMQGHRVRRVPVVDAQRKVVGLISLNDIARRYRESSGKPAAALKTELADTLAAVGKQWLPAQAAEQG